MEVRAPMADSLEWDVFVSAQIRAVVSDLLPGAVERAELAPPAFRQKR